LKRRRTPSRGRAGAKDPIDVLRVTLRGKEIGEIPGGRRLQSGKNNLEVESERSKETGREK